MNSLVTVVIPTYSRPDNLSRAIDSVLGQTYSPIEIIVVDDNGIGTNNQILTEKTLSPYLEKEQIIYLKHEVNKNGSAARNTGLTAATGEFICFLDDDDEYLPSKIEDQVKALQNASPKIGGALCSSNFYWTDALGNKTKVKLVPNTYCGNMMPEILLSKKIIFSTSLWLMRTSVCREQNGFDESFRRHQDLEFLIRFSRKYEIISVKPDTALVERNLTGQITRVNLHIIYEVKKLLLNLYKDDIEKHDNYKFIYYKVWENFACAALSKRGYSVAIKSLKNAHDYEIFKIKDCFAILRSFAYGIVKR